MESVGSLVLLFFLGNISHIIQLTPQQQSAETRNSAGAEALAVARTEVSFGWFSGPLRVDEMRGLASDKSLVSLHTILSLPILYGVWHIQRGSGEGHTLRKRRATVLQ